MKFPGGNVLKSTSMAYADVGSYSFHDVINECFWFGLVWFFHINFHSPAYIISILVFILVKILEHNGATVEGRRSRK